MPVPRSVTLSRVKPSFPAAIVTWITVSGGLNFAAFDNSFSNICSTARESAFTGLGAPFTISVTSRSRPVYLKIGEPPIRACTLRSPFSIQPGLSRSGFRAAANAGFSG